MLTLPTPPLPPDPHPLSPPTHPPTTPLLRAELALADDNAGKAEPGRLRALAMAPFLPFMQYLLRAGEKVFPDDCVGTKEGEDALEAIIKKEKDERFRVAMCIVGRPPEKFAALPADERRARKKKWGGGLRDGTITRALKGVGETAPGIELLGDMATMCGLVVDEEAAGGAGPSGATGAPAPG